MKLKPKFVALLAVLLLPLLAFAAGGLINSRQYIITNSSTSAPTRLAAVRGTYARAITVLGNKDYRTGNTGTVYIGPSSTNDQQVLSITTGQILTLSFGENQFIDLYDWYLDVATADDGVVVIYSN